MRWRFPYLALVYLACGETPPPSEEPIVAPPRDSGSTSSGSVPEMDATTAPACEIPKTPCNDAGALCLLSKHCGAPRKAGATCGASWECASGRCDPTTKTCTNEANACGIFFDPCTAKACCDGLRCVDLAMNEKRCDACEVGGVPCPEDAGPSGCCSGTCVNGVCSP